MNKTTKKGLSPVLILIIVAILFAGWQIYRALFGISILKLGGPPQFDSIQPPTTQDPTANWKVYINDEYNYSLQYPTSWIVQEKQGEYVREEYAPYKYIVFSPQNRNFELTIGIRNKGEKILLTTRSGTGAGDIIEKGFTKIGQYDIETAELVYQGKTKLIFFGKVPGMEIDGHEIYGEFYYSGSDYTDETDIDLKILPEYAIVNQILSTFKFIE